MINLQNEKIRKTFIIKGGEFSVNLTQQDFYYFYHLVKYNIQCRSGRLHCAVFTVYDFRWTSTNIKIFSKNKVVPKLNSRGAI